MAPSLHRSGLFTNILVQMTLAFTLNLRLAKYIFDTFEQKRLLRNQ